MNSKQIPQELEFKLFITETRLNVGDMYALGELPLGMILGKYCVLWCVISLL